MLERGSEWGIWDLHIHTPASFHWNGGHRFSAMNQEQRLASVRSIVERMNQVDPVAFATQDYWTFDGYRLIREHIRQHGLVLDKTLFPGIELRVSSPTRFRLNFHVIFSDEVPADRLDAFVNRLRLKGRTDAPLRSNLIDLARKLGNDVSLRHGIKPDDRDANDESALELGTKTATVTPESVEDALSMFARTEYVVVQPFDTSDGLEDLDWESYPVEDRYFSELADMFEAKNPSNILLFHGVKTPANQGFIDDWIRNIGGRPKPVVRGSDAHRIEDYGVFHSNRKTWFKGRPSFETLMHAMADPVARNWIGDEHPDVVRVRSSKTKVMSSVSVRRQEDADHQWFDQEIPLNSGLVVVIGNKGSGKSALADCLALAANAHGDTYSFLTTERFRTNPDPSPLYQARIDWLSGAPSTRLLSEQPDSAVAERARYLPQQFVEEICNNIDDRPDSDFERALRTVILRHLGPEVRREASSLDEVMERVALAHTERITALRQRLGQANRQVVSLLDKISSNTRAKLNARLATLTADLEAHGQTRPTAVPRPDPDDPERQAALAELDELRSKLAEAEQTKANAEHSRRGALGRLTRIEALATALRELEEKVGEARRDLQAKAAEFDLDIQDLVKFSVAWSPVATATTEIQAQVDTQTRNLDQSVEGTAAHTVRVLQETIRVRRQKLTDEQERFEAYQAALREFQRGEAKLVGDENTPDTIKWIESRLSAMDTELPNRLADTTATRDEVSRQIHQEILATQRAWRELFTPVQDFVDQTPVAKNQAFQFAVSLSHESLQERLFRLVTHKKKGEFYGVEDGKNTLVALVAPHDLGTTDGALACAKGIWNALAGPDESRAHSQVSAQLRREDELVSVLDLLFGFEYLAPFFTLTRGGSQLRLLSPGERGAVLLIFYLLVDPDNVPLIVDQPEQNLDNETVYDVLVPCFREARTRRQVIMVTHNPNLAVVCDADQVIRASFDRSTLQIRYTAGGLEDSEVAQGAVDVLEGTLPAFERRRGRYVFCGTTS